ncbi:biotin--protein ligase isoform X2 [Copidosoma floridanum]|uniref:biotin--protein ligase isoform X2 n=1 Tax=Copidosoma floridanum TaxID=29053 RepID=UPI0006C99849|nr:biotin--protein ligase isoform X2 [Copidosoma floridanum]
MLLTLFYMVATWVQSWRLSSLRTRLQSILQGPEATRPTVMLYTAATVQSSVKDENNGNKNKLQNGHNYSNGKDMLSSHFCNNSNLAKLGDLLWYQGDKRLCTIYPQQQVDVSDWLLFPLGKTIFPLFIHNNAQTPLQQNAKMHVLIEADLNNYIPQASSKATKLEDYGLIVTWTSDKNFGVILETDLDHITKFSTTLMQGQCFINNGLPVTRIESVSVFGKPCVCNHERFNLVESTKLISGSQWDTYVKKLRLVSSTSRLVSQQNQPIEVKEIPGLVVSPGSQPITLQMPTVLEMKILSYSSDYLTDSPVPSTPPPTPALASSGINGTTSRLDHTLAKSIDLNSSVGSLSNLSSARSQEFILEDSSMENLTSAASLKAVKNLRIGDSRDTVLSTTSVASSRLSLATPASTNYSTPYKTETSRPNGNARPPNIFICADSAVASDNVRNVLETILKENKYTIYSLSAKESQNDAWMETTNLVIVCGNVGSEISSQVVEFLVRGGKLLALCSDILTALLPTFKTAEVRENELVRFSYGKWKHVRMMHHVFCYQASPIKTKFSQDQEESKSVTPPTPVSASVSDRAGKLHAFDVKVLGSEETWHTPSILLARMTESAGRAVFSQIHLEADPAQYELFEESKLAALKQSNLARLEIFADLLGTHLGVEVTPKPKTPPDYCPAFFLGRHDLKIEMLKQLKNKMQPNDVLKTDKIELQFCGTSTHPKPASATFLPIMVHRCPDNFSTVEYFENLNTEAIGRLVIYSDIMTSSNDIVSGVALHHGLAVLPLRQTKGQGRNSNAWLSPEGCAMFTVQLHIPLMSPLGGQPSLIQHLTVVAIVTAVKSIPGYQDLDLRIKWPNDIYEGGGSKIGGLVVKSIVQSTIICNIGMGVNLSNSSPTTCINDMIKKYNDISKNKLKKLSYEKFLALSFNELEKLINIVQNGNLDYFYELYYKYWMHTDAEVTVVLQDGSSQEVKILGIDKFGFLQVKGKRGNVFTVHPDGNSFDIMKGLIAPKA